MTDPTVGESRALNESLLGRTIDSGNRGKESPPCFGFPVVTPRQGRQLSTTVPPSSEQELVRLALCLESALAVLTRRASGRARSNFRVRRSEGGALSTLASVASQRSREVRGQPEMPLELATIAQAGASHCSRKPRWSCSPSHATRHSHSRRDSAATASRAIQAPVPHSADRLPY